MKKKYQREQKRNNNQSLVTHAYTNYCSCERSCRKNFQFPSQNYQLFKTE